MFKFNFAPDGGKDFEEDSGDDVKMREEENEPIASLKQHDFAPCSPTNSDAIHGDICEFDGLKYFVHQRSDSDLQNGYYEGGNVVWECTLDLLQHLEKQRVQLEGKSVLDLGCGQGLLGIWCLKGGASKVHFTDYNDDVIAQSLRRALHLNQLEPESNNRITASSGDWRVGIMKINPVCLKSHY